MTYRAAIIGTGRIASLLERDPLRSKPHTHAGWYRHHPQIELVAGADIDPGRLAEFGRDWGIPQHRLFTDYLQMLEQIRPDLVSICAYAPQRLEQIEASIRFGARGLWIEKAIACSLREIHALKETLHFSGVKAIVDHPRRADPAYRAVRRVIREKSLGKLLEITCSMSGSLIHTGTHAYDMLDFWCGPVQWAAGWLEKPQDAHAPLEDCGGHGHIVFENGVHAFVVGGTRDYYLFQFDLTFTRGRIQIGNDIHKVLLPAPSRLYSGFLELFEAPDYELSDPYPRPMVYDLVHALESGEEPLMSVDNAVTAFRTGLSIFQSHLEGHRPVRLEELDETLRILSV